MKQLTIRTIFAAAAMLAVSAVQTQAQTMKAEVPFPFTMHNVQMPAGTYNLQIDQAPTRMMMRSTDGTKAAVAFYSQKDPSKELRAARKAVMVFECTAGQCLLVEVYDGSEKAAFRVYNSKPRITQVTRTDLKQTVYVSPINAN